MEKTAMEILDRITQGLANGGMFSLDPNTVTMFGNLLAAAVELDAIGRPTEEQLAQLDEETRGAFERFTRALDQLKGWTAAPAAAPAEPKLQLVDRTGAPLDRKRAKRRLVAVH